MLVQPLQIFKARSTNIFVCKTTTTKKVSLYSESMHSMLDKMYY